MVAVGDPCHCHMVFFYSVLLLMVIWFLSVLGYFEIAGVDIAVHFFGDTGIYSDVELCGHSFVCFGH